LNFLHDLTWVLPLRSPALTQLAFAFSWLGYSTFIMFFMALGYWACSKAVFYRLLILVALNALLNAYAKDLFQDPRPPLEIRLDDLVGASYGLPSGHAQLAVVMWMWLAWEIRKPWAWFTGSAIAVGVMASRLYLGVHDLEDVLGGAVLGGASLLAFEYLRRRVALNALWMQMAIIFGLPALALLTWPGAAPEYIPTLAGWLAAATWGQQIEQGRIGMRAPTSWPRRIGVLLLGTACFLVEQKLLKAAGSTFPIHAMAWALIKGAVSGLFVSLFMPWLLCKIRLTGSKTPL
jgi:membrane-associated phospholipid phosphatase